MQFRGENRKIAGKQTNCVDKMDEFLGDTAGGKYTNNIYQLQLG
jgi:hypothetical protein